MSCFDVTGGGITLRYSLCNQNKGESTNFIQSQIYIIVLYSGDDVN